jgi:hypothetical protein
MQGKKISISCGVGSMSWMKRIRATVSGGRPPPKRILIILMNGPAGHFGFVCRVCANSNLDSKCN